MYWATLVLGIRVGTINTSLRDGADGRRGAALEFTTRTVQTRFCGVLPLDWALADAGETYGGLNTANCGGVDGDVYSFSEIVSRISPSRIGKE